MNITFIISSLQCGGAERVVSNMANYWSDQGHAVSILKYDSDKDVPFYKLNSQVKVISMDIMKTSFGIGEKIANNIKRIHCLRESLKGIFPDVIISFMTETNILSIISNMMSGVPIIVSERIDPAEYKSSKLWDLLRRITYVFADAIVIQTENVKEYFGKKIRSRCTVIPNSIAPCGARKSYNSSNNIILAMGRLEKQKGFDTLIHAFEKISTQYANWQLHIYGAGPLYDSLKEMIDRKTLVEKVLLKGITKDPSAVMLESDIFVLASRAEGFPNVLLEAMSLGLPVVSTDCNSGPRDIITDGFDGALVEVDDVNQMADAIKRLMVSAENRAELGENAFKRSKDFNEEAIMKRWENVIMNIIN